MYKDSLALTSNECRNIIVFMKIAGLSKNSFVDYPAQIAAVVFTVGCNYDCYYCHNRSLISFEAPAIDEMKVIEFLKKRVGFLDALVITGGEPTLQNDLEEFIIRVKDMGYLIKLDTNGSNPDVVKSLLDKKLLNYIAMDLKAPFDKYKEFCGLIDEDEKVKETLDIIKQSGIEYEVRTTFVPQLSADDIKKMLEELAPITNFALQSYRMPENYKKEDLFKLKKRPHSSEMFEKVAEMIKGYANKITIR